MPFHMTPHRIWLREYEEIEGGDVLIGDDSLTNTIVRGKVCLTLKDGSRGTLPSVLHIPVLARNLISITIMSDAGVHIVFEKDTCKMVWGAMVLMRGV